MDSENISRRGREILMFYTYAQREQIKERKAADVLLARSFFDEKPFPQVVLDVPLDVLDPEKIRIIGYQTAERSIEYRFERSRRDSGLPYEIFEKNEIRHLIRALG